MSSDSKKNLKETLLNILSPPMREKGFKWSPRKDAYVREYEGGADIFQLVFLDHDSGWRVRPHVGVRHERVEDIFHQTSGFEQKYQKGTSTVGASIEAVVAGTERAYEFILESSAQLNSVAKELLTLCDEVALPYFDRWSTLESIDAAINEKPSEKIPHLRGGLGWFRCSTGIIVAKLVGRKNYDDLVAFYADVMAKDNKGFYLKRFEALVNSLRASNSGSE